MEKRKSANQKTMKRNRGRVVLSQLAKIDQKAQKKGSGCYGRYSKPTGNSVVPRVEIV